MEYTAAQMQALKTLKQEIKCTIWYVRCMHGVCYAIACLVVTGTCVGIRSMSIFREPNALPCGHVFCKYALLGASRTRARVWVVHSPCAGAAGARECIIESLRCKSVCPLCKAPTWKRQIIRNPTVVRAVANSEPSPPRPSRTFVDATDCYCGCHTTSAERDFAAHVPVVVAVSELHCGRLRGPSNSDRAPGEEARH